MLFDCDSLETLLRLGIKNIGYLFFNYSIVCLCSFIFVWVNMR